MPIVTPNYKISSVDYVVVANKQAQAQALSG